MKQTHSIRVTLDAKAGETVAEAEYIDGELYYVTVTPYTVKRAHEERVTKLNERLDKAGISLGPMNSSKCPLCGR